MLTVCMLNLSAGLSAVPELEMNNVTNEQRYKVPLLKPLLSVPFLRCCHGGFEVQRGLRVLSDRTKRSLECLR